MEGLNSKNKNIKYSMDFNKSTDINSNSNLERIIWKVLN